MTKNKKEEIETTDVNKIKEELNNYVNERVRASLKEELDKSYNRLLREKNKKIFFKNVTILFLFILIGFMIYYLYQDNYFAKYVKVETSTTTTTKALKDDTPPTNPDNNPESDQLKELKEEYSSLLDNYIITENSAYLKDFYQGKLTNELKNYLALNYLDFNNLKIENNTTIIESKVLNQAYNELFNDQNYQNTNFSYDNINLKYFKMLDSYLIENELIKNKSNIAREIIDIKKKDNTITITTIEGLIKNNKLYNILTNVEIKKYQNDSLINYQNKLNKVVYTFKDNKLDSLS